MLIFAPTNADMAKLVDVPDLGSGAARRVGSSPIIRTESLTLNKLGFFILKPSNHCPTTLKKVHFLHIIFHSLTT